MMGKYKYSELELEYMLNSLFQAEFKVFSFNIPVNENFTNGSKKHYRYSLIAAACIFCTLFTVLLLTPFLLKNTNDPSPSIPDISTQDPDQEENRKIVYGVDSFNGIQKFEVARETADHTMNISQALKNEIGRYGDNAYYRVIIAGSVFSGKDFWDYKYEGYTYSEYQEFYKEARAKYHEYANNNAPEELIKQLNYELNRLNNCMEKLCAEYEIYYKEKYGTIYGYLESHYSFVDFEKPADFDNISLEDYDMLATASYDTVIELAKDNFSILLAPASQKTAVNITEMDEFLAKKLSPRIMRDLIRGDPVDAIITVAVNDIESFNEAAANALGVSYDEIIQNSLGNQSEFYKKRNNIYIDYLNGLKNDLMCEYKIDHYKIDPLGSSFPYIKCTLSPDLIKNFARDARVAFIENYCEWQITDDKLQTYGGDLISF